ncbi:MAG TPA: LanC-like protein [Solirubrobacteraceae bacterium]|nr:LanC-like protein [Solirubrobacteraceae bacterium]
MLWRPDEHEPLTNQEWDPDKARDAIAEVVADAEAAAENGVWPTHPLDEVPQEERFCSVYLGGAGMIWGLHRLGSNQDLRAAIRTTLQRYRSAPAAEESTHAPSLLLGETGILAVAQKLGAPVADERRLSFLVRANREYETWELLWGSPGTMLAARACGLDQEWQESAALLYEQWDTATDMWTHHLYGRLRPHIGAGHGFASNVHALRGFVDDDVLKARVASLLTRTAHHEEDLLNWPPEDRPWSEQEQWARVQWCHGAPGIITTLADLMPPEMAIAGGEMTWRAGPLRKGHGLCHGTAGNGFAFLKLYDLTGDERWLGRARRFAMHAIDQVARDRERYGRGRYTLWTGDIGAAVYLKACLDAEPAFPIMDNF